MLIGDIVVVLGRLVVRGDDPELVAYCEVAFAIVVDDPAQNSPPCWKVAASASVVAPCFVLDNRVLQDHPHYNCFP